MEVQVNQRNAENLQMSYLKFYIHIGLDDHLLLILIHCSGDGIAQWYSTGLHAG
jgi:hypothetical protein